MQRPLVLTANTDGIQMITATRSTSLGFSWNTQAGASYGGGTLTLYYRCDNSALTDEQNPWQYLDVPAAEEQATYHIGSGMQIGVELTGATAPDIIATVGILQ